MNDELAQPGLNSLSKSFEPAALEAHWGPEWERRNYGSAGYRGSGAAAADAPAFAIQHEFPAEEPLGSPSLVPSTALACAPRRALSKLAFALLDYK